MIKHDSIKNMIVFAMLGALLFASKIVFEVFPNIHPVAMLIMVITVVYRAKALISIYIYVLLLGAFYGFAQWWYPYLYIWTVLWGFTMLIPRNIPKNFSVILYPIVCGLFGISFGILYAPVQALMFNYDFPTTIKWVISGLPFDLLHAAGNFAMGFLVYPLSSVVKKIK